MWQKWVEYAVSLLNVLRFCYEKKKKKLKKTATKKKLLKKTATTTAMEVSNLYGFCLSKSIKGNLVLEKPSEQCTA